MSAVPFLTDDEIFVIVKPLTQPAAIMRWFHEHGFPNAQRRPNGMPLVSRVYFDQVTAGIVTAQVIEQPTAGPNVAAYLDRISKSAKSGSAREKV